MNARRLSRAWSLRGRLVAVVLAVCARTALAQDAGSPAAAASTTPTDGGAPTAAADAGEASGETADSAVEAMIRRGVELRRHHEDEAALAEFYRALGAGGG